MKLTLRRWQRLLRREWRLAYQIAVVACVVIGAVLLIALTSTHLTHKTNKTALLYSGLLGDLYKTVMQVQSSNSVAESVLSANSLDAYDAQMTSLDYSCYGIRNTNNVASSDPKAIKESASQAARLCNDLIPVADYSKAVYKTSRDLLLLDPANAASDSQSVSNALQIINATQTGLQNLNYPTVNDPARDEISTILKQAATSADSLKTALVQNSKPQAQIADFTERVHGAQTEIINARVYYWNNTIEIGRLLNAINTLQVAFKNEATKP